MKETDKFQSRKIPINWRNPVFLSSQNSRSGSYEINVEHLLEAGRLVLIRHGRSLPLHLFTPVRVYSAAKRDIYQTRRISRQTRFPLTIDVCTRGRMNSRLAANVDRASSKSSQREDIKGRNGNGSMM